MQSRRTFLKQAGLTSGLLTAAPGLVSLTKDRRMGPFGFQVWTIREQLFKDFPGTMKMMANLGYSHVEMCSPLGYSEAGFAPLHKIPAREMRSQIEDSGLTCVSSHFTMGELQDHLEDRIAWTHAMGFDQMVLASFWLPKEASVDDYRKAADELNGIAAKTKAAGIQMGFHNHHVEFEMRGEERIYDAILDELDEDLVKLQFQVAVVNIGVNAADYFRKYPGRFISAHLSDWSQEKDSQVPIGQGVVDWNDFFKAGKKGGLKNVFVEMDPATFEPSAKYLRNL